MAHLQNVVIQLDVYQIRQWLITWRGKYGSAGEREPILLTVRLHALTCFPKFRAVRSCEQAERGHRPRNVPQHFMSEHRFCGYALITAVAAACLIVVNIYVNLMTPDSYILLSTLLGGAAATIYLQHNHSRANGCGTLSFVYPR